MKFQISFVIFSILSISALAAWHGKYRNLDPNSEQTCKIRWDPHVWSHDHGYQQCNYIDPHPYPCYESDGITINCVFSAVYPGSTESFIESISILFTNGRYREGYTADGNGAVQVFESGATLRTNEYTGDKWLLIELGANVNNIHIFDFNSQTSIWIEYRNRVGTLSWYNLMVTSNGKTNNKATGLCPEGCPFAGHPYQANLKGRRKREIEIRDECRNIKGETEEETKNLQSACSNDIRFIPAISEIIQEDLKLEKLYQARHQEVFENNSIKPIRVENLNLRN